MEKIILLVDNDFYTKIDFLEAFGDRYTIHSLTNGLEAYRWLLDGNTPDIILSEFSLPGYSGLNFLEDVKTNNRLREIPFIFICSENLKKNIKKARLLGANDIYSRPLSFDRLRTRVDTLIRIKYEKTTISKPPLQESNSVYNYLEKIAAGILFLILSPLFILVALLIKIDSKGPVFSVSYKVGKGYRKIKDYRFRSEKWQKEWNSTFKSTEISLTPKDFECGHCKKLGTFCSPLLYINDKSICERAYLKQKSNWKGFGEDKTKETTVGKLLRKTKVEMLPNLFNVIIGNMSFKGESALFQEVAETLTVDKQCGRIMSPIGMFQNDPLRNSKLRSFTHQN